jgi:hypothetical protein
VRPNPDTDEPPRLVVADRLSAMPKGEFTITYMSATQTQNMMST